MPLGKYWWSRAVGVLVGSALPGTLRVAEVDVEVGVCAELGVLGHFDSLVPGQRAAELLGQGGDRRSDGVSDGLGAVADESGSARCGPVAVFRGLAWVEGVPAS